MARENTRIVRKSELVKQIGLSHSSIWRRERRGEFPKRVRLGGQSVGWLRDEVEQWIRERADERGADA